MRDDRFRTEKLGQFQRHIAGRLMTVRLPSEEGPLSDSDAFCQLALSQTEPFPHGPDSVPYQRARRLPPVPILPQATKIEL